MKSSQYFDNNKRGITCLNCGQPLRDDDNFCSECGQVNDTLPLSLKQFVSEFFAGFFSFDSRFFKTITPLLFKPGKVSREYIEGKRKKYANPFKLYLHTSIVFFLLMGLLNTISNYKNIDTTPVNDSALKDSIVNVRNSQGIENREMSFKDKYEARLDTIFLDTTYTNQFNSTSVSMHTKDSLYAMLHDVGMRIKFLDIESEEELLDDITIHMKRAHKLIVENTLKAYFMKHEIDYKNHSSANKLTIKMSDYNSMGSGFGKLIAFSRDNPKLSPVEALDSLGLQTTRFNFFQYQKAQHINKLLEDKDFRKSYFKSIVSKISIALFFLLPFFTLFFSLLYLRHRYNYTEHLVVVFNLQTVFFLVLIVGMILDKLLKTDLFISFLPLVFLLYFYKTLRNFYKQGRMKTISKFLILNMLYFLLAFIGFMLISFLTFIV